ncbi:hypothetical protein [Paenibacillus luteus]|uniref:hypothetical protein n=1 Tax=Paenibacillus luteus TaxID=2545753 RepID=UPI0011417D59|nr:hypothetical protein [Paenibacillus luteus]
MLKVALIHGPYDDSGNRTGTEYVMELGFLVDDGYVMYVGADRELWMQPARVVDGYPTLYTAEQAGYRLALNVEDAEAAVNRIVALLANMSGWRFLIDVLLGQSFEIEFDL